VRSKADISQLILFIYNISRTHGTQIKVDTIKKHNAVEEYTTTPRGIKNEKLENRKTEKQKTDMLRSKQSGKSVESGTGIPSVTIFTETARHYR